MSKRSPILAIVSGVCLAVASIAFMAIVLGWVAWPDYMLEPIDIAEQRLAGNIQQGRMKAVIKPNAIQISRMETVLLGRDGMPPWLNGAVKAYPEHRRILIVAVKAQARLLGS